MSEILWEPSQAQIDATLLHRFAARAPVASPSDYHELWEWSVTDLEGFWGQCGTSAA